MNESLNTVTIVGAGAVARAFAGDLALKDVAVRVWARRLEAAEELKFRSGIRAYSDLRAACDSADLVLIAVSDPAIQEVAEQLARAIGRRSAPYLSEYPGHCREKCFLERPSPPAPYLAPAPLTDADDHFLRPSRSPIGKRPS